MSDDDLVGWGLPNASLETEGSIGFPEKNDMYVAGIYMIYTVLSDRYAVTFTAKDLDSLVFKGPEIDISGLEPDFEAGELSEFVLAHKIDIDKKEETLLDFMEDIDGLRQSIMIVQITEDEDEQVLYTNCSGEEYYSNQCLD